MVYDHVEPLEKSKLEALGWGWWGCNNNLPTCNNILEPMEVDTFEWFQRGRPSSSADSCQVGPPFGKVKCNVDEAFGDNKGGIGMCICDHNGNFVKVKTMCYSPLLSVKEGEAQGWALGGYGRFRAQSGPII
jgi:hypothetical protein